MQKLIRVYRSVIGAREYPKFIIINNLNIMKQAVMEEANQLTQAGVLEKPEEIIWFSLQELKEIIDVGHVDRKEILRRRDKFLQDAKRNPPRVMSSDGEIITAKQTAETPSGSLTGSPVSSGIVEGRARVVLKLEEEKMAKGDILVAPYTDPAWTALFPLAAGLVTEAGGLMTHGAVVAREYGIPAVVGVENATNVIPDGAHIRVDGTRGIIEILE
jgi:pyruvate,water dikinase